MGAGRYSGPGCMYIGAGGGVNASAGGRTSCGGGVNASAGGGPISWGGSGGRSSGGNSPDLVVASWLSCSSCLRDISPVVESNVTPGVGGRDRSGAMTSAGGGALVSTSGSSTISSEGSAII